jgi:TrmH family RNA methyltransferase
MEEEFIQSRQNPRVKLLSKLRDRSGRRKLGLFVVEGLRELSRCVEAVGVEEIYFCPEFFKSAEHSQFIDKIRAEGEIPICRLSEGAFEKVSNREGCDGLLGVAKQWGCLLSDIDLSAHKNPTILVADSIEKPGNLGALIRSADSLGAGAIILTNSVSDIFNPAVVRASQGAVFSAQIALSTPQEASQWLKERGIKTFGAHLGASDFLWNADMSIPSAIVVGSEKDGLGEDWNSLLDCKVKIPMSGLSDSMNVNVAGAIFLYEALRQKSE